MSPIKEAAIRLIESLPDNCTLEDIQYHLSVRERIARRVRTVDEGRVVPQEEAEKRIAQWATSIALHP